jgi:hypothetical protein
MLPFPDYHFVLEALDISAELPVAVHRAVALALYDETACK